jgi:hypothetical protein
MPSIKIDCFHNGKLEKLTFSDDLDKDYFRYLKKLFINFSIKKDITIIDNNDSLSTLKYILFIETIFRLINMYYPNSKTNFENDMEFFLRIFDTAYLFVKNKTSLLIDYIAKNKEIEEDDFLLSND